MPLHSNVSSDFVDNLHYIIGNIRIYEDIFLFRVKVFKKHKCTQSQQIFCISIPRSSRFIIAKHSYENIYAVAIEIIVNSL